MIILQKKFGILWQYCRDTPALDANGAIVDFNAANVTTRSFNIKAKKQVKQATMPKKMLK